MKTKILSRLKQEYSHLGLGDTILQAHAEAINAMGLANEDNLETIIGAQKQFLENLQRENDRRASDAYKKAKATDNNENDTVPEWFKAEKSKTDELIKSLQGTIGTLSKKNAEYEAEKLAAERLNRIEAQAKSLGIPEYRIKEGFAIAESADEGAITAYLTSVANNIKTQMLPGNKIVFPHADGKIEKSETDEIAKSLVG